MQTIFSLLFYLKKPKHYTTGPTTIYVRITINGKRAEFSTGRECNPERWNSSAGRSMGSKADAKALNSYLDTIQAKLYDSHRQLLESGTLITAEILKNKYSGKSEKPISLVKIFQDHNNKVAALVGNEFAKGTLDRYKTSLKHTVDFLKWKYKVSDIDIRSINYAFITEYEFYLRSVRNCANNSAVKYIKNFGKIIRICIANEWLEKNPFANYTSKVKEVEKEFLTERELYSIATKQFFTERLSLVRDLFLFCCFTGLAYIDAKRFDQSNLVMGIDGERWIHIHRKKTKTLSKIPLLPEAQIILTKYKNHPQCISKGKLLPILSNQKMNAYLKEIADLCEITKNLTFHTARHTFATFALSNNVPIESVSKMLGHTNISITQHYAKIIDKKLSDDMKLLREKLTPQFSITSNTKTGNI